MSLSISYADIVQLPPDIFGTQVLLIVVYHHFAMAAYISSLFRQCSAAHRTLITQQYKSRQTDTHTYESEDILHN